jgi:preprotein translocase subunit SecE
MDLPMWKWPTNREALNMVAIWIATVTFTAALLIGLMLTKN